MPGSEASLSIPENLFEESINFWTLTFKDPEEEAKFRVKYDSSFFLPLIFKILAYSTISLTILHRVYVMLVIYTGANIKTGTFMEELTTSIIVVLAFIIEGILKLADKLPEIRGFLIYITLPLSSINAGFYTQRMPAFGIPYFSLIYLLRSTVLLIMTPCTVTLFINRCWLVAVGNITMSFTSILLYLMYFVLSLSSGIFLLSI